MGVNWGNSNEEVAAFDEQFGLTLPTVSGTQGGGNGVFELYEIASTPTVIVITPDHLIVEQFINPPTSENIVNAVTAAGGILVGTPENKSVFSQLSIYPNPVNNTGYLSFYTAQDMTFSFKIVDLTGTIRYNSSETRLFKGQQKVKLPVHELKNGMYFVQLITDEKIPETIRFVVAK